MTLESREPYTIVYVYAPEVSWTEVGAIGLNLEPEEFMEHITRSCRIPTEDLEAFNELAGNKNGCK